MATEKQIEANRLNAQKSTGPTSPEGKAKITLNAFKHGMAAQTHLFAPEETHTWGTFVKKYIAALKPEGFLEECAAERIAVGEYRLARAAASEDNMFALSHFTESKYGKAEIDTALSNALVFRSRGKELALLTLYEQRIRRALEKDKKELRQLQAERKAERTQVLEQAKELAMAASASGETYDPAPDFPPEIGFVLSTTEINAAIDRDRRFVIGKTVAREQKSRLTAVPKAA